MVLGKPAGAVATGIAPGTMIAAGEKSKLDENCVVVEDDEDEEAVTSLKRPWRKYWQYPL